MTDSARRRRARAERADGFTLVEVVIVTAIMGILAAAIAVSFSVVVRTLPPTDARADDARSLLGISNWLPADVSATPRVPSASASLNWDKTSTRPSGCSGTDPGTNLLRLQWREAVTGAPVNFVSSYRLVAGTDRSSIVRVSCRNGGGGVVLTVTAGLPPISTNPAVVTFKTETEFGVEYIIGAELMLTTLDGDILRVDASSRNPSQTLSTIPDAVTTTSTTPATTTTTTPASTTTTTTTTPTGTTLVPPANVAPTAGPVSSVTPAGSTIGIDLPVADANGDPLAVTLDNVPDGWTANIVTADALATAVDIEVTPPAGETANIYNFGFTVTDPTGASASSTISVDVQRVPCVASFLSIVPNPVTNTASGNGNGNQVGQLSQFVTVSVNKSGNCSELALRYTRVPNAVGNVASADDRQPQIDVIGSGIAVTFAVTTTERWQKGDRAIQLVEFPGLPGEIVHATQILRVN